MTEEIHRVNRLGALSSLIALVICILIIDFRSIKWMTILYVMFFFAGTGSLIGIASRAGKRWGAVAIALFLAMTFLAFWQRAKTGM